MSTRREMQERIEELENALEQARDSIDEALDLENPEEDDDSEK